MCCLDPKYDKINSSIDSRVYVCGYVDSPQLSWYCTVFALERQYCECDCMLSHSFDLLTNPPEKHLGTRCEAKRLCQNRISFSLQLKTKTLGQSYFYLKHVDYIILFVLAAPGRWVLRSNLPFVLSLSIRNDILFYALSSSLCLLNNIYLAIQWQTIPPSLASESGNAAPAQYIISHNSGYAIYSPERYCRH